MTNMASHGKSAEFPVLESNKEVIHSLTIPSQLQIPVGKRSIEEVIKDCWEKIEENYWKETVEPKPAYQRTGWKAVRLFVSSTFHDFQSEREVLVKKVFPELKEWCMKRQLHLIECDLRWGIPKDSTTAAVLCTCMDEIDRCHGEADGQGMFLTMLGERYGWVPGVADVPPHLVQQFQWVHNLSVTHMEILRGALYRGNRNAAFFIRDPTGWLDKLPEAVQSSFIERSELGRAQLKVLKSKLREKHPNQCFDYSCHVDEPDNITGTPVIKGLDDFGNHVLSFFKEAITREYPIVKGDCSDKPAMREQFCHDCVLEQKGAMVLGRDREYSLILQYAKQEISEEGLWKPWAKINPDDNDVDGKTEDADKENEKDSNQEKVEGNRNIAAIIAEPGAGKSSLLAKCAIEARKMGLDAFIHFVGCSGISTCHLNILTRLCLFLLPHKDPRMEKVIGSDDSNFLQEILDELLEKRQESGKPLLILIDDLSQVFPAEGNLSWIPKKGLPGNITLITTMIKDDRRVIDSVRERTDRITWLNLGCLTDKARYEIVTSYLKCYNKILDPEQTKLVITSEGSKNALWLSMACEELRVFGVFDLLTKYIRELPCSLDALLEKILLRIVSEDETSFLKQTLCFIECARDGLREETLQLLLGDMDEEKPVPMLHWAMINRTLKPFIRIASGYQQLNQLMFYHQAIGEAVRRQWMSDEDAWVKHHRILADYFQYHCTDDHILAREAAYHISHAKDGARMLDFIKNDTRSRYIDAVSISRYIKQHKCTKLINTKMNIGGRQLFSCQFCCNMRQAFSKNQMFPNKDSCVLCGKMVPDSFKRPQNEAHWCGFHPTRGPYFGNVPMCYICKRPVMGRDAPIPLYLCNFCHVGGFTTCCHTKDL